MKLRISNMGIFDLNRIIQFVKTDLLEVKDESSLNFADVSYDGQFHLFLASSCVH